ncbi:PAS/PAC Sensor Hybrid Histidine Kinase [gamma proteobacterium IMCC2047]|nr:PAS/PAC Sensor Hybrid Histidine Kinase [gamma proteobacterium IMCC2047]
MSVFEDFYQIDNKERDRGKGLGLGLAIAKRLTGCLGHELECSSILGKGSRFAVLVEACEGKTSQPEVDVLDLVIKGLTGTRILLIEDDIDVLKATRQILESWGCIVYFGRNVNEVLRVTEENRDTPPDMIVADSWLPGDANGVEVVGQVRDMLGVNVPAVIVTGDMDEEHIREITGIGFPVLPKPVQPAKLRATISHMTTAQPGQE